MQTELPDRRHGRSHVSRADRHNGAACRYPEYDFRTLDCYEGVKGGYYKRVNLPVRINNGNIKDAIVYVMCGEHEFSMPSETYYLIIKQGYKDNKISQRYLYNAIIECAEEELYFE